MDTTHRRRSGFLIFAILLTLWGGSALLGGSGYTDALYWPDYTIKDVPPGTVLAEAGFLPGDSVVAVEGIPVVELGMYSRWPRSLSRRAGESLVLTVERDGTLVDGTVVYRPTPPGVKTTRRSTTLLALTFLWAGIWVLYTTGSPHASRLAVLGIMAGLALPGPNLGSLNGIAGHVQVAAEILLMILLFHFFLLYPTPKRLARSELVGLLYVPWIALLGCLVAEVVMHPRLYHAFGGVIGLLFLGYLVAAVGAIAHTCVTRPRDEMVRTGMRLVLGGWIVAIVPNLVALAGWIIPPGFDTPGQRYFPYLLVAIPLGMALAVRREGRTRGGDTVEPGPFPA